MQNALLTARRVAAVLRNHGDSAGKAHQYQPEGVPGSEKKYNENHYYYYLIARTSKITINFASQVSVTLSPPERSSGEEE